MKGAAVLCSLLALAACSCNSNSGSTADTNSTSSAAAAQPQAQTVPASLQTEAYDYYGLAQQKPVPMILSANGQKRSGAHKFTLESVQGDRAVFRETWTGDLEDVLETKIAIQKDGIFGIETAGKPIKPEMELPSVPVAGTKWNIDEPMHLPDGRDTNQHTVVKIVGPQKVQTGLGTFDSILLQETGTVTIGHETGQVTTKKWLVKGKGTVKMEVTSSSNGHTSRLSLEVAKT